MKKLLIPLFVLIAACGGASSTAATVNGVDISVSEVEAMVAGAEGAVEPEAFRNMLRILVVDAIATGAALDDFQIEPTEADITAMRDQIKVQVGVSDEEEFLDFAAEQGYSAEGVLAISRQQAIVAQVTDRLVSDAGPSSDADLQALYDDSLYLFVTEACVKHILAANAEDAAAARQRILDGEDFADVAAEVSTDPSAATNFGDLGCAALSQYVPEFGNAAATATIGEVTDPVESQFGFHLVLVESRVGPPSLAEVRDQLEAQLSQQRGQQLFEEWLVAVVTGADVQIDPRYGTWSTDPQPQILPPASESDAGSSSTQP